MSTEVKIEMEDYRVEIDRVNEDEWSKLLLEYADATIYQTWSYGGVRWGRRNISHLVLKRNGVVVGLSQVVTKIVPLLGAGVAYVPWGPLWRKEASECDTNNLRELLLSLYKEYVVNRNLLLRIAPNIIKNDGIEVCSMFEELGFKKNISVAPYRTFLVDLSPSLIEMRRKLDQKWRNQLNRSEQNGLNIKEGSSDQLYGIFLRLQKEMQSRKQYKPGVDYDEFRIIQEKLPQQLKMRIHVCEFEGKPVTATLVSAVGDSGIYLLGATGDEGLKLKGAYLSQWLIIQWLKKRGCRWYDLGGINPEKNPGVYHFKAGLSGKDVCHIGQYELCDNPISSFSVKFYEKLAAYKRLRKSKKIC